MEFSIPPNEASQRLMKVFGLDRSKVVEFHIHIENGKIPYVEIKQLVTVEELAKIVEVLRKYKFEEDV